MAEVIVVRAERDPRLGDRRRRRRRRQVARRRCGRSASRGRRRRATVDGDVREREAGDVRVRGVERLLRVVERLVRRRREDRFARPSPVTLAATMPDPASAVSKVIGTSSPAFGERGPVTTSIAFAPCCRAAIAL